ncbi:MAG: hypothetical protein SGPRY_013061, partial [Prymnesium sp.]
MPPPPVSNDPPISRPYSTAQLGRAESTARNRPSSSIPKYRCTLGERDPCSSTNPAEGGRVRGGEGAEGRRGTGGESVEARSLMLVEPARSGYTAPFPSNASILAAGTMGGALSGHAKSHPLHKSMLEKVLFDRRAEAMRCACAHAEFALPSVPQRPSSSPEAYPLTIRKGGWGQGRRASTPRYVACHKSMIGRQRSSSQCHVQTAPSVGRIEPFHSIPLKKLEPPAWLFA